MKGNRRLSRVSISHSSPQQNQLTLPSHSLWIFFDFQAKFHPAQHSSNGHSSGHKFKTLCMLQGCLAMLPCLSGQGMSSIYQTLSFVSLIIFHDLGMLSDAFPQVSIQLGQTVYVSGVQDRQWFDPLVLGVSTASLTRLRQYGQYFILPHILQQIPIGIWSESRGIQEDFEKVLKQKIPERNSTIFHSDSNWNAEF